MYAFCKRSERDRIKVVETLHHKQGCQIYSDLLLFFALFSGALSLYQRFYVVKRLPGNLWLRFVESKLAHID